MDTSHAITELLATLEDIRKFACGDGALQVRIDKIMELADGALTRYKAGAATPTDSIRFDQSTQQSG